jgi:hypothetical protein
MTVHRSVLIVGSLLGVLSVTACGARSPGSAAALAPASCGGQRYLEVRNGLEVSVDVYAYRAGPGGTARFLGRVGPGVERLPVFETLGFAFAERDGQRVSGRRGRGRGDVSFSHVCQDHQR